MRRRYALASAGGLVTLSTLVCLGFGSGTQADCDPRIVRERELVAKAVKPLYARVDIINALKPSCGSLKNDRTEIFDMVVSRVTIVGTRLGTFADSRMYISHDGQIVGAGATGAGIALDAASRGLKVALLERGDFACGERASRASGEHRRSFTIRLILTI